MVAKPRPSRAPAKAKADTDISEGDWVTTSTVAGLVFATKGGARDTTAAAQHLNKYKMTPLEQQVSENPLANTPKRLTLDGSFADRHIILQYLSQTISVSRPLPSGGVEWLPALALHGVRIQYKKPHPKYGKEFVQMAVPTPSIQSIVDQLVTNGVTFGTELVQEETVRFLNGTEFTTFRTDIKKLPCAWKADGLTRSIRLGDELKKVKKDLRASVVFNLALKYKGPRVAGGAGVPMALKFEAVRVVVKEAERDCVDEEKAVANESWSEKVDRLGVSEGWFGEEYEFM